MLSLAEVQFASMWVVLVEVPSLAAVYFCLADSTLTPDPYRPDLTVSLNKGRVHLDPVNS